MPNKTPLSWKPRLAAVIARSDADANAPKQQRSRTRRAEIVQAAVRVFAREGITRARIADVAAEAGVPLSSVYDYFADKEELAYALPITHIASFLTEFQAKVENLSTARERVQCFLWLSVDFARRNPDWARTLYLEIWPSVMVEKTVLREMLDEYARILQMLIADGERNGEWGASDTYETMSIFVGSINQLIVTWLLYRSPRDIMKATNSLVARLLNLLGEAEPARHSSRKVARGATARQAAAA